MLSRAAAGSTGDSRDVTGDNDKRDILDLLKLSYIVVRTGIGTGQIMVMNLYLKKFNYFYLLNAERVQICKQHLGNPEEESA